MDADVLQVTIWSMRRLGDPALQFPTLFSFAAGYGRHWRWPEMGFIGWRSAWSWLNRQWFWQDAWASDARRSWLLGAASSGAVWFQLGVVSELKALNWSVWTCESWFYERASWH